jgi:hypothetical protein
MCKKLCVVFLVISFISCAKPENQKQKQDIAICPGPSEVHPVEAEVHPVEKDPYEKCGKVTFGEGCILKCDKFTFLIECQKPIAQHYIEAFNNSSVDSFIEWGTIRFHPIEKALTGRYTNPVDFSKRDDRVEVVIVFPDQHETHIDLSVF